MEQIFFKYSPGPIPPVFYEVQRVPGFLGDFEFFKPVLGRIRRMCSSFVR